GISNLATQVDQSPAGMQTAYNAVDAVRQLIQGHRDYTAMSLLPFLRRTQDTTDLVSFPSSMSRAVRTCINANGSTHWETRSEWETALLESYNEQTVWHEFGHVLSLQHNFMGSVDKNNWPTYKDSTGATQ